MEYDFDTLHAPLYESPARLMGELHWIILRAHNRLSGLMFIVNGTRLATTTQLGREIGRDEIRWWLHRKEKNVPFLRDMAEQVLGGAEKLKEAAFALRRSSPSGYTEMITALSEFTKTHQIQIAELAEFAKWLDTEEFRASILFAHAVWGSTRRSRRTILVTGATPGEDPALRRIVDIVFGLYTKLGFTLDEERSVMLADAQESRPLEDGRQPTIDRVELEARTCRQALIDFADYFGFLRDSLRDIVDQCDYFVRQIGLARDDAIWVEFIRYVAQTGAAESEIWDVKETLEMWHAASATRDKAQVTFCEQVASFANHRGGAMLIGITNELPRRVVGVTDVENRLRSLGETLTTRTDLRLDHYAASEIRITGQDGNLKRCIVLAVARTPHVIGVRRNDGTLSYPVRQQTGLRRAQRQEIASWKKQDYEADFDFMADITRIVRSQPASP